MSDSTAEAVVPGSAALPADSGVNAGCSATDEQHDWVTAFTGLETRTGASTKSDAGLGSAPDGTAAASGDEDKQDQGPPLQTTQPDTTGNSDQQTAGQDASQAPDEENRSSDPDADDSDLTLDPKSGQSGTGGFTKTPEDVEKEVTDKFGKYIPKDQLANPASKVTNFQDNSTFQNELKQRHPDLEKQGIDPNGVVGESYKGKIYINKDKADIGTAYHEQLHHYSSSKFISSYGVVNGVKFNEGVTEYLTRKTYSGNRSGHYDTEEKLAEAVAKKVGDDVLEKAYFEGDDAAMKKVSDALAGK